MNFNEYQRKALASAIYPNVGQNPAYPALGLCGEAGEVAEKIKKVYRDSGGFLLDATRAQIAKELGDVLWYVAALASEIGVDMGDIAAGNIDKLASRKERGTLSGSGDER